MKSATLVIFLALAAPAVAAPKVKEVAVTVTAKGFEPAEITIKRGDRLRLVVTRKVQRTCATEIVFKEIDVKHDLPLDQAVTIDLPAQSGGTLNYACGMNMVKGSLVVQ